MVRGEVEKSGLAAHCCMQISRLAYGSLEMTLMSVFYKANAKRKTVEDVFLNFEF
jgi:hypothetical protein